MHNRIGFAAASFVAVVLAAAATASAEDATGTLDGNQGGDMRVLIRKIDDGPILWAGGYQLGTGAKIAAGHHDVSVMCELTQGGMVMLAPGSLSIDVEANKIYKLAGTLSSDQKKCAVTAAVD